MKYESDDDVAVSGIGDSLAEEAALVEALVAGRDGAFEELDRRYRARVLGFCRARLGDPQEAEDLAQEVFLQIHRSIGRYEGRASLICWILGIAHNQLRHRWRRRTLTTVPLEEPMDPDGGPIGVLSDACASAERVVAARELLDRCDRLLDKRVTELHHQVFRLRYGGGHGTREIAELVGKSDQAIKMSLHRSRRALEDDAVLRQSA